MSKEIEYPKYASQLTEAEIDHLLTISLRLNDCFRHDTSSSLGAINDGIELALLQPESVDVSALELAKSSLNHLSQTLQSFSGIRTFHETLACSVDKTLTDLKDFFNSRVSFCLVGACSERPRICFPTNILYWILHELASNALRHGSDATEPDVRIQVEGGKIAITLENSVVEVHPEMPVRFQPVTALMYRPGSPFVGLGDRQTGKGLHTISRILHTTDYKFLVKAIYEENRYIFYIEIKIIGCFDQDDRLQRVRADD